MTSVDDRIAQVEADLRRKDERIIRLEVQLEKKVDQGPPEGKSFWELAAPYFSGLVVLAVGYYLNDSVNHAFHKQELELSNAKEMQQLLVTLGSQDTTPSQAEATTLTLSAFGAPALAPLINVLETGGEIRTPAAVKGIRAIGLAQPVQVCERMRHVLENRTRLYALVTHRAAIQLLGDLDCRDALPTLRAYETLLGSPSTKEDLQRYAIVVNDRNLTLMLLTALKEDLDRSLKILSAPLPTRMR